MAQYITGDELAAIIKSDQVPGKDYLVVDVRDDDYAGGNIVKGQNWPSQDFYGKVGRLVGETKDVKTVVFHCALSQVRGPKMARIYGETRDRLQAAGADSAHQVLVLQGGFTQFQAKFKDDPKLVENWDKSVWEGFEDWS
ncbi:Rhodanese-like protein [Athelia psychrophila]|uniref:Rhodanese-like protein n=1 Tax=Athelia psychrophila TaxID=1759441 RepID=A0A166HHP1_9AGAM|nr:Rhodanese-like protein [Fibularhizoctonia sp. CBS 109695]